MRRTRMATTKPRANASRWMHRPCLQSSNGLWALPGTHRPPARPFPATPHFLHHSRARTQRSTPPADSCHDGLLTPFAVLIKEARLPKPTPCSHVGIIRYQITPSTQRIAAVLLGCSATLSMSFVFVSTDTVSSVYTDLSTPTSVRLTASMESIASNRNDDGRMSTSSEACTAGRASQQV